MDGRDPRLERDMRVFLTVMNTRIGAARTQDLARLTIDKASEKSGPPNSLEWFQSWGEVMKEVGTPVEEEASTYALSLVKKLWDAGY